MKNLFFFVFSIVFAISCSNNLTKVGPPTIKIPPQSTPEQRYNFSLRFMLLDESGAKNPPVNEQTNTWPIGILLSFPSKTDLGYCSTSHIEEGKLLTNAHCIKPGLEPEKYYVVFYNKYGIKDLANIEKIEYVGDHSHPQINDIAILTIKKEDAERWHTTSNRVKEIRNVQADPPVVDEVTIWSFDPIQRWPQYIQKWKNEYGMVFHPNNCLASHTLPEIRAIMQDGESLNIRSHFSPEKHLIMDNCEHPVVKGNSGSLVTLKNDFNSLMATAFSTVDMQPYGGRAPAKLLYGGNKRTKTESAQEMLYNEDDPLYVAAFGLDYFNKKLKP